MNFHKIDLERGFKRLDWSHSRIIFSDWLDFLRMNLILKKSLRGLISIKNNYLSSSKVNGTCLRCLLSSFKERKCLSSCEFLELLTGLNEWVFLWSRIGGNSVLFIGKEPPPLTRVFDLFDFVGRWVSLWLGSCLDLDLKVILKADSVVIWDVIW